MKISPVILQKNTSSSSFNPAGGFCLTKGCLRRSGIFAQCWILEGNNRINQPTWVATMKQNYKQCAPRVSSVNRQQSGRSQMTSQLRINSKIRGNKCPAVLSIPPFVERGQMLTRSAFHTWGSSRVRVETNCHRSAVLPQILAKFRSEVASDVRFDKLKFQRCSMNIVCATTRSLHVSKQNLKFSSRRQVDPVVAHFIGARDPLIDSDLLVWRHKGGKFRLRCQKTLLKRLWYSDSLILEIAMKRSPLMCLLSGLLCGLAHGGDEYRWTRSQGRPAPRFCRTTRSNDLIY